MALPIVPGERVIDASLQDVAHLLLLVILILQEAVYNKIKISFYLRVPKKKKEKKRITSSITISSNELYCKTGTSLL